MNIDKYIAELLYDFECVTIPGFGAFIANDRPAVVNKGNHQFKPPFRQLIFNVQLQSNDGLLVNQLASSEGISFNRAKYEIDKFVKHCFNQLALGKILEFKHIGNLFYDENQHVVFQQDRKTNYFTPSFGLKDFVSPPVKRLGDENKPKGLVIKPKTEKAKPADRKIVAKRDKKRTRILIPLLAALVLVLIGFGWAMTHTDQTKVYLQNTASLFPFFNSENAMYSPRAVTVEENLQLENDKPLEDISALIEEKHIEAAGVPESTPEAALETAQPESREEVAFVNETVTTPEVHEKKIVEEPIPTIKGAKQYYIIAGSFSSVDNANKLVAELKAKGYTATLADTSKANMYRVAYASIDGLGQAKEKLYAIRQEDNPDAWILRK